jgi:hypothetical protein
MSDKNAGAGLRGQSAGQTEICTVGAAGNSLRLSAASYVLLFMARPGIIINSSRWTMALAWRVLSVDRQAGSNESYFKYDVTQNGPGLALGYSF